MQERDVFYIPGYDPRGFRFYYSLFKKNLHSQEKHIQDNFKLSKSQKKSHIEALWTIQNQACISKYHFLMWNDIVRSNWHTNIFSVLNDTLVLLRIYIFTGLFIRFFKASKPAFMAGLYAFLYLIVSYVLVFILIFLVFMPLLNFFLASFLSFIFLYFATKLIFKLGNKNAAFWIARICVFCAYLAKGKIKGMDIRILEFSQLIFENFKANAYKKDYELILCAHSVGSILAICVLANMLKKCEHEKLDISKIKVLTLGQCVPLMSLHKQSKAYKKDLEYLADQNLFWFDFSSKIDGACFYKFDFFTKSGVERVKLQAYFLSPNFYKLYSAKTYAKLKRAWYKVHFLYLMPSELKGEYDFFYFVAQEKHLEEKLLRNAL